MITSKEICTTKHEQGIPTFGQAKPKWGHIKGQKLYLCRQIHTGNQNAKKEFDYILEMVRDGNISGVCMGEGRVHIVSYR